VPRCCGWAVCRDGDEGSAGAAVAVVRGVRGVAADHGRGDPRVGKGRSGGGTCGPQRGGRRCAGCGCSYVAGAGGGGGASARGAGSRCAAGRCGCRACRPSRSSWPFGSAGPVGGRSTRSCRPDGCRGTGAFGCAGPRRRARRRPGRAGRASRGEGQGRNRRAGRRRRCTGSGRCRRTGRRRREASGRMGVHGGQQDVRVSAGGRIRPGRTAVRLPRRRRVAGPNCPRVNDKAPPLSLRAGRGRLSAFPRAIRRTAPSTPPTRAHPRPGRPSLRPPRQRVR
jgi:hypothetical protein